MFLRFDSKEDRKKYGGSCFTEIQFCFLPDDTPLKKILNGNEDWRLDSLYVHGDSPFYSNYKDIFGNGIHRNMMEGFFDDHGITYYKADQIDDIVRRSLEQKPEGYELLSEWLEEAKNYNGFYICGI